MGVDVRLVDFGSVAQSDETLAFLTSKSQVCSSFVLTDCQMQALRKVLCGAVLLRVCRLPVREGVLRRGLSTLLGAYQVAIHLCAVTGRWGRVCL